MNKTRGHGIVAFLTVVAIAFGAATAGAVIRIEVVVLLGVELSAGGKLDAKLLRELDLALIETPSLTWDGDKRPVRRFLGRRLLGLPLQREGDEVAALPIPAAAQLEEVRGALGKIGIADRPRLILVVQHSGGK
jgi:hypothetical protein